MIYIFEKSGNVNRNWAFHDDKELSLFVLAMKMAFWLSKKMSIYF